MKRSRFALLVLGLSGLLALSGFFLAGMFPAGQGGERVGRIWLRLAEVVPGSAGIAYNSGVALYRQREYRRAAEAFSRAIRGGDPRIRAAARYNLGNTLVRLGEGVASADRAGAGEFFRQASAEYGEALKLDRADRNARHNRAVAEGRLQALRAAPSGASGDTAGATRNHREAAAGAGRRGRAAPEQCDAAEVTRAAAGNRGRRDGAKRDGKSGSGTPQPLRMTRQEAEALLVEHRSSGGPTAIFRDGGRTGQPEPVLKEW